MGKAIEFIFRKDVHQDYSPVLNAYDLCINSRRIRRGAGAAAAACADADVGTDTSGADTTTSTKEKTEQSASSSRSPSPSQPPSAPRTRTRAVLRHALLAFLHLSIIDTVSHLLRSLAWDTIGRSDPPPHAVDKFIHTPLFFLGLKIAPWVTLIALKAIVGVVVWQGLVGGYHILATIHVGLAIYPTEAWEVDMFERPWRADSVLDFWARWHQLFRVSGLV